MSKGVISFLIAALIAAIGFLIYWFFFRKKTGSTDPVIGTPVASGSNPISVQDVSNVGYVPVSDSSIIRDSEASVFLNSSAGFKAIPQETLTAGTALTQRSNNPGALFWDNVTRWQGMDDTLTKKDSIIYFYNSDYGIRAHLMTLKNYARKHGINTLSALTARYAPFGSGGNDPVVYARLLASYLGMDVDTKFDMDANRNLLAAIGYYIHRVEAGYYWISRERYLDWSVKV
jgi:hypothetical protein